MGSVTHPERALDTVRHVPRSCSARNSSRRTPSCTSLINANSPMVWDATMLGAAEVYAAEQPGLIITPFILSGAMSPVTVAGTLAQVLAEVLAGVSFVQLVRPGAPAIFGTFVSTLSMQSGAPTFGTPEAALAIYGAGQLARRMKMPFRTGGSLCASKIPDAQAAYESAQTLVPTIHAGANFVLHAAGWMEGGLASSYEKFVMDCDQLGMMHVLAKGIDLSRERPGDGGLPPGRAGRAFPRLRPHPGQFRDGLLPLRPSPTTIRSSNGRRRAATMRRQRANKIWKKMLAEYEAPPIDPGIDEALRDFIERRRPRCPTRRTDGRSAAFSAASSPSPARRRTAHWKPGEAGGPGSCRTPFRRS